MNELTIVEIGKKSKKYITVHSGKEEINFYADPLKIGEAITAQRLQENLTGNNENAGDALTKWLEFIALQLEKRCVDDKYKKRVTGEWVGNHFGLEDIQETVAVLTTGKVSDPK